MSNYVKLTITDSAGFDIAREWYFDGEFQAEADVAKQILNEVGFAFTEEMVEAIPEGDFESVAFELETTLEEEGIL